MQQGSSALFQTEIEFTLPKGYIDQTGVLHRYGSMRLATAADEILPLRDPRVQENPAYLAVIVLSRVIVKLGSLPDVDVKVIEGLFAADFEYVQRLYEKFNGGDEQEASARDVYPMSDSSVPPRGIRAVGEA